MGAHWPSETVIFWWTRQERCTTVNNRNSDIGDVTLEMWQLMKFDKGEMEVVGESWGASGEVIESVVVWL